MDGYEEGAVVMKNTVAPDGDVQNEPQAAPARKWWVVLFAAIAMGSLFGTAFSKTHGMPCLFRVWRG